MVVENEHSSFFLFLGLKEKKMLLLLVLAGTGKSFILACILEEGGMSLCVQLFYLTKIV